MQYRTNPKNGDKLSVLGYGCMRFSRSAGVAVNQKKAEDEMALALERGVNYFDTAYLYPGSEVALGKFLAKGHRKDVFLATKLPYRQCKKPEDFERFFAEQKARLKTEYIDYYLVHMLGDIDSWNRLLALGIKEWVLAKKAAGEIRAFGFSYHGGTAELKKIVDAYDWDFCQIQINYMDAHSQAGVAGMKYAAEKGMPIFVMEPLRGGSLVSLPKKAAKIFADAAENASSKTTSTPTPNTTPTSNTTSTPTPNTTSNTTSTPTSNTTSTTNPNTTPNTTSTPTSNTTSTPTSNPNTKKTPVAWALQWLWNYPELTVVLSGMNSIEQVKENCSLADAAEANVLTQADLDVYDEVVSCINEGLRVPCTACGYCMPCPHGVDIPSCFAAYNRRCTEGWFAGIVSYIMCTSLKEKTAAASACKGCGLCEKKCPQGILIRDCLNETKSMMEGRIYRMILPIVKKFLER